MRILFALLACLFAAPATAQNHYALDITAPDTTNNHAQSYYFRAYPGIPYERPVAIHGGCAPFTAELTMAPSGMTITDHVRRPGTGGMTGPSGGGIPFSGQAFQLNWTNPTGTSETVAILVTDCDGSTATSSFTLTIGTSGWKFFADTGGSDSNSCMLASPCETLAGAFDTAKVDTDDILVFRTGTYSTSQIAGGDVSDPGTDNQHIDWNTGDGRPTQFLAYPGETVTLDFAWSGSHNDDSGRYILLQTHSTVRTSVIDGFLIRNCERHCVRFFRADLGATLRNLDVTDISIAAGGGDNASAFLYATAGDVFGDVMIGVEGHDFPTDSLSPPLFKIYDSDTQVIVYVSVHSGRNITSGDGWIAPKGGVTDFSFRAIFSEDTTTVISGNMAVGNGVGGQPTGGEFAYLLFLTDPTAICLTINDNRPSETSEDTFVYRSTLYCDVRIDGWDAADETLTLQHNVVINDGAVDCSTAKNRYTCSAGVTDYPGIVVGTDLSGAAGDGIIDATTGDLLGSNLTNHGPDSATPKGHMTDADAPVIILIKFPFNRRL